MTAHDQNRPWMRCYHALRILGADTFVPWASFEGMSGNTRDSSRASLTRARQELECQDGLTLTGQNAKGFWIRRQEHATD